MMNYLRFSCLIILIFGILACQTDSSKFSLTGTNKDTVESLILFDDIDLITIDGDGAAINSVTLSGDMLILNVSYGGGCEEHKFKLYVSKGLSKSNPPQAEMYLLHNANGDLCEAYLTENLAFNLLPLKENIKQNFNDVDELWLRIYPPGSTDPVEPLIRYKF
jgi:uncharacterized protein YkuJ